MCTCTCSMYIRLCMYMHMRVRMYVCLYGLFVYVFVCNETAKPILRMMTIGMCVNLFGCTYGASQELEGAQLNLGQVMRC